HHVFPARRLEVVGHPARVCLDLFFVNRGSVGIPAIPSHGRSFRQRRTAVGGGLRCGIVRHECSRKQKTSYERTATTASQVIHRMLNSTAIPGNVTPPRS